MKRITILVFILLLMLTGCGDSGNVGNYALIEHDNRTFLVVKWTYPNSELTSTEFTLDESPLDPYIDENTNTIGEGLPLNRIEGVFSYEPTFIHWHPVKIPASAINMIKSANIPLKLTVLGNDGETYEVTLRFDPSIRIVSQ